MNNQARIGVIALPVAVLLVALLTQLGGGWFVVADRFCDYLSMRVEANEALARGDQMTADYRFQEANVCEEKPAVDPTQEPSASPSVSATETPSVTPTTSASATPSASPTTDSDIEEFLANRPAKTKTSPNAYGPMKAVLPSLDGKLMEDLNAQEAFDEHIYVIDKVDRMQTASAEFYIGLWTGDVNDRTKQFVKDRKVWDDAKAKVVEKLQGMNREIKTLNQGVSRNMSLSFPGKIPQVSRDPDVKFGYDTHWLVYTDSKGHEFWFRLACHFQNSAEFRKTPPPSRGMIRTPEGEVKKKVKACNVDTKKIGWTTKPITAPWTLDFSKCKESPTSSPTPTPTSPSPTPTCPEGSYCSPKATATQPTGVASPTDNPVDPEPTAKPTKKESPLKPSTEPTKTSSSGSGGGGHGGGGGSSGGSGSGSEPTAGGTPTATANEG